MTKRTNTAGTVARDGHWMLSTFAAAALFLLAVPAAHAQTSADLMLAPWEPGQFVEVDVDFYLQNRGHVRRPDAEGIRINTFEADGRLRFEPEATGSPSIGFDVYHLNLSHGADDLPQRLTDQQLAFGMGVTEWEDWQIGFTAGFGFAGDTPYADRHAWYATGNLFAARQLDEDSVLHLALNYDGNRTLFPDVPLPGVAYTRRVSEDLTYTVGVPYNALRWRPLDRVRLDLEYTLLFTLNAELSYELLDEHLFVFAGVNNRYNGFHRRDDDRNRRVFFQQRRAEAGVRLTEANAWEAVVAGGYAFDQRLERGWDVRDTSTVAKFSDEPYVRIGFEVSY